MELPTHCPLDVLTDHGDVLEIDDVTRLRLVVEQDDVSACEHINDASECYGTVEWVRPRGYSGRCERPEGYDGRARIVARDGNHQLWWQPPTEDRTPEAIRAGFELVKRLCEDGFLYVAVVREVKCSHGDWHEDERAGLGATDSLYPELVPELVAELS